MLVNDLDVRITNIKSLNSELPYILNPAIPSNPAVQGDNIVDNIEKIVQLNPAPGLYRIRVSHKGVLGADQNYSLIISDAYQPDCLAEPVLMFDNVWDGSSWEHALVSGEDVLILDDFILMANTTFGNVYLAEGVEVAANTAEVCTILGNAYASASALISADVVISGSSPQTICGELLLQNVELNNSNGLSISSGEVRIYGNLVLTAGTCTTNDLLTLAASTGNYAQIHEAGGAISGNINYQQIITISCLKNIK